MPNQIRHSFGLLLAVLFLLFAVAKVLHSLPEIWSLFHFRLGGQVVADANSRLVWSLGNWIIWSSIGIGMIHFCSRRKLNGLLTLAACGGWGILLLVATQGLLQLTYSSGLGTIGTRMVLIAPLALILCWLVTTRTRQSSVLKWQSFKNQNWLWTLLLIPMTILVLAVVVDDAYWLTHIKSELMNDEHRFWWPASIHLHSQGLDHYLNNYREPNYAPAYPMLASLMMAWVPSDQGHFAGYSLPLIFALSTLSILLFSRTQNRPLAMKHTLIALVVFALLILSHRWIYRMFFELWYAESLAVISIALMLLAFHVRLHSRPWMIFTLAGIGVLCRMGKPPLSVLTLPAIVPGFLLLFAVFYRGARRKEMILRTLAFGAGALLAHFIWTQVLAGVEMIPSRSANQVSFDKIDLSVILSGLVPFLIQSYKQVWIPFICIGGVAIMTHRKYWPAFLISLGVVLSIFVLYATYFSDMEYQSGGRYVMHGAYGFLVFWISIRSRVLLFLWSRVPKIARHGIKLAKGPKALSVKLG